MESNVTNVNSLNRMACDLEKAAVSARESGLDSFATEYLAEAKQIRQQIGLLIRELSRVHYEQAQLRAEAEHE